LNKLLLKATPLITAVLLLTLFASPVFATGAHLWFYSVEPPIPLPNPDGWDPNYVDTTSDPWTTESVVSVSSDWDTPFSLWIGNADSQDDCYDTTLVISVNDAAAAAIASITITPGGALGAWDTVVANFPLPPHGISVSAEYYGFASKTLGDIPSGGKMQVTIDITLNPGADLEEAKIHFDAYGWSTEDHSTDPKSADITNPFSHDYTFIIPEATTAFAAASSLLALGTYAYRRRKK